ncbi:site-specific integrase [Polaromonas sp. UBA4122]|uniref:site-specific integrase n=1 Tax=Polaromonas sp. UBA4122 TaxID=1947074 RepID=UPI0025CF7F41|nr:site-specific integrase [Polaromonas sp. UBA4122]
MDLIDSPHPTSKARLLNSALAPHLDAFSAHFRRGRYATNTTQRYVAGIAHFARWMTQQGLPIQRLDEHAVEQFLSEHLPRCDCPTPVVRVHGDLRAALGHLLEVLREHGAVPEHPLPTGCCCRPHLNHLKLIVPIQNDQRYH